MFYAPLTVVDVAGLGPRTRRITFTGDGLAAFTAVAPDQQAKLFFARDGGVPELPDPPADRAEVAGWYARYLAVPEERRPWMRTYSVRRHHPDRQQIEIDFVLHEGVAGPAADWAAAASPGDVVGFYGPAEAHFRPPGPDTVKLFAGDETALPAIGAWLEALAPGERATVHVQVTDAADEQDLHTAGDADVRWHHRGHVSLVDAVRATGRPGGLDYGWLAGEASEVRALRRLLVDEWGMSKRAVCFAGYWRRHLTHDDAPTGADEADAVEMMADYEAAVGESGR